MGVHRTVRVPIYWLFVGAAVMFISPLLSIWASVTIAERNARETQQAQAAASEKARIRTCGTFTALLDVYIETPPSTAAGRGVQEAYLEQYRALGCEPPRKK